MAFLVQHGTSRKAAAARGRKPRDSAKATAKNPSRVEPGHRQLAACFLALVVCICVARLLSVLSSRVSSGNGVYLVQGSLVSSDDAEGVGAVNSWQASISMDVPQGPSAPVLPRADADPFRRSPESDTEVNSNTTKNRTNLVNKSVIEEQTTSSSKSDSPPKTSFRKPGQSVAEIEVSKPKSKITCDDKSNDEGFPYARPIVCKMSGDVRVAPESSSVALTMPMQQGKEGRGIRPYARQDDSLLHLVRQVVIKAAASEKDAPKCSISHSVPAIIFSIGGYTGNFFHDVSDVLIPLYLTSFQFKGRVKFFITNYKQWWIQKYKPMLRRLSRYDIIDFDSNKDVHCFQHVTLGLVRDRDLILRPHPTRNPKGYSMLDFTRFLRHSYGLRRDKPLVLGEQPGKKPRMLIISRRGTRKLQNLRQVAAISRALGFDVIVSEAGGNLKKFAMMVNSCDVLLAVHGAGLTNQVFLPVQAVVIQIVPWGRMDWMATNFYGEPARGMNLKYLEYYISEEESSLAQRYPGDHIVFKDPMAIHGQGWNALAGIIMTQDVRLNLRRFKPTLLQALDLLQV
ncbi:beta-1,2-xylosyltransferease XAX1-like isoform X2 [Phragmites australis]|uniref:beta-1,2-xylosyltransferease XAX1-like isoform X2 n=1 Tax=Phragmites australis TaxID=29695 RepID=UPI002D7971E7|nr:beta-1,2-xylosyltransferease XAX1-like isoform X2 [Phragmites australis]